MRSARPMALAISFAALAPGHVKEASAQVLAIARPATPSVTVAAPALGATAEPVAHAVAPARPPTTALPPLLVRNINTGAEALVGLYSANGSLDDAGVDAFRRTAGDGEPAPLAARVVQIVAKAAYELGVRQITLVSTIRPKDRRGRGGYHTTGEAIDFQLVGVPARTLASYLRKLPRVGVGIYTHPKTQYVHVDVRDQSYHWLDASPPGKTWKEAQLKDAGRDARDAAYRAADDLPVPPATPVETRAQARR